MTTFAETDVRCAVCGELQRVMELTSTSSFGPPDLDLRPGGPQRWALPFTVQRCRACSYCASQLGAAPPGAVAIVESAIYRDVLERSRLPRLARSLFCSALVREAASDPDGAAWRFLEAAWACDDLPDPAHARLCRERAAEMFRASLEAGDAGASPAVVFTLLADVLRRAGRFDEAVDAARSAAEAVSDLGDAGERSTTANVARYISALATTGDDAAHCAGEAFAED